MAFNEKYILPEMIQPPRLSSWFECSVLQTLAVLAGGNELPSIKNEKITFDRWSGKIAAVKVTERGQYLITAADNSDLPGLVINRFTKIVPYRYINSLSPVPEQPKLLEALTFLEQPYPTKDRDVADLFCFLLSELRVPFNSDFTDNTIGFGRWLKEKLKDDIQNRSFTRNP